MYWYNGNLCDVLQEVFTGYKMKGKNKIYLFLPAYSYIRSYSLLNNWSSVHSKGWTIARLLVSYEGTRCFRVQIRRLLPTSWVVTNVSKQQTVCNLYWSCWRYILLWETIKKYSLVICWLFLTRNHQCMVIDIIFVCNFGNTITLCYIREALTRKFTAIHTWNLKYMGRIVDSNTIVASRSLHFNSL